MAKTNKPKPLAVAAAAAASNPAPVTIPKGPPTRMFYSDTGENIRVTLPDGGVAVVGTEPRELPAKYHRAAQRAGCVTTTGARAEVIQTQVQDDPHERMEAIVTAITNALEAEPAEGATEAEHAAYNEKYGDAFNQDETPNVRWLEKQVGFNIDQAERDQAWATVKSELGLDEDGDGEDDGSQPNTGFGSVD